MHIQMHIHNDNFNVNNDKGLFKTMNNIFIGNKYMNKTIYLKYKDALH